MKKILIQKLKLLIKEKEAIILAHYYTNKEVQEIADFVGDSLALAQFAKKTESKIIVFAAVNFMAETAKILNPTKKVLLPDLESHCSLSDSCNHLDFKKFISNYPNHTVISYINCSTEVKMLSDIICTSSNAIKIVESLPRDEKIIFAPDRNLGNYIKSKTKRDMIIWDGFCHIHEQIKEEEIIKLKKEHPDAKVLAHPECRDIVLKLADFVGSTNAMLNYTLTDNSQEYIVLTENGILYQMKKNSPNKIFYTYNSDSSCSCSDCEYMKLNTIEKIYNCLLNENNEILLSDEVIEKAKKPLLRMLDLS